jgi:ribose/xylose/arabinose/galactoside ABC-type transport system permease subunit
LRYEEECLLTNRSTALAALFRLQEVGLIGVVVLLTALLAWLGHAQARPGQVNLFLNAENIVEGVITPMSIYTIMAVGMTCVIITGGIDISVGSVMALAALGGASTMEHLSDAPAWVVVPAGIFVPVVIGIACGCFNGVFVVGLGMHPFIVTLGSMGIFRCLAIVLPSEATLPSAGRLLPEAFRPNLMSWSVAGVEVVPLLVTCAVVAVGVFFMRYTVSGREIYAVGGNEEAARYSGIRVARSKFMVYVLSGACAGIAAVVSLGRFGTASSNTAQGYELAVVAGAVIGGASLAGGRGTAIGALLGTLIIALIENGIITFSNNREYRLGIIGSAILLAVAIERLGSRRRV